MIFHVCRVDFPSSKYIFVDLFLQKLRENISKWKTQRGRPNAFVVVRNLCFLVYWPFSGGGMPRCPVLRGSPHVFGDSGRSSRRVIGNLLVAGDSFTFFFELGLQLGYDCGGEAEGGGGE